jgi:thiol-disulfide isomerase/thioredoxin
VEENFGDSDLARRFGVTRYPAIFVGDVLIATPNDFGFYGRNETDTGGRYAPLQSAESHTRLRDDLTRMIRLMLTGNADEARLAAHPAPEHRIGTFPPVPLQDMDGRPIEMQDLRGRIVLVEFWATWCPPCRTSLRWLADMKRRMGDDLVVITLAVQSDPKKVRSVAGDLSAPFRWVTSTPEMARAFGDVTALPTLLVFDREGRTAASYFGAPPGLHRDVEVKIASLPQAAAPD